MGDSETEARTERGRRTQTTSMADRREYWRRNLRLIGMLFVVWFVVSFLVAIILARPLMGVSVGQVPLPFWMAQQGSIIVFVLLIFIYAWRMNKLDREFGVED